MKILPLLSRSELLKECLVHLERLDWIEAELKLFNHSDELFTVNQFDWRNAVADGISGLTS